MIWKGIITSASGSIGGITASRNRGGQYFRARVVPTDPNTNEQQAMRGLMASITVIWNDVLTAAQRAAWDVYAANVPMTNRLGDTVYHTGLNHFYRSNAALLQNGGTRVDAAPTTYNLGEFTAVTVAISEATQLASVGFDSNDDWAKVVGGYLLLYLSRPQNESINYFRGPYQLAGSVDGAATPPTSPETIAVPFACVEGQKVFARAVACIGDGRFTASQFLGTDVAA